jgi:putative transposase
VKKTRHAPEQIVKKLREAEMELAKGATVATVTKKLGVTEQTYYWWKRQYGSMDVDHLGRLKELERENSRLKKIVAEQAMNIDALKDIASKKMVGPSGRRRAVVHLIESSGYSARRACRLMNQPRFKRIEVPTLARMFLNELLQLHADGVSTVAAEEATPVPKNGTTRY